MAAPDEEIVESHRILAEHELLRREIRDLAHCADGLLLASSRPNWVLELAARIEHLRPRLAEHFAREVECGFFDKLAEEWPNCERACLDLQADHYELLVELDAVSHGVRAGRLDVGEAVRRTKLTLTRLERHEERENALLHRTLEGGGPALD